jgi:hypothetical protein
VPRPATQQVFDFADGARLAAERDGTVFSQERPFAIDGLLSAKERTRKAIAEVDRFFESGYFVTKTSLPGFVQKEYQLMIGHRRAGSAEWESRLKRDDWALWPFRSPEPYGSFTVVVGLDGILQLRRVFPEMPRDGMGFGRQAILSALLFAFGDLHKERVFKIFSTQKKMLASLKAYDFLNVEFDGDGWIKGLLVNVKGELPVISQETLDRWRRLNEENKNESEGVPSAAEGSETVSPNGGRLAQDHEPVPAAEPPLKQSYDISGVPVLEFGGNILKSGNVIPKGEVRVVVKTDTYFRACKVTAVILKDETILFGIAVDNDFISFSDQDAAGKISEVYLIKRSLSLASSKAITNAEKTSAAAASNGIVTKVTIKPEAGVRHNALADFSTAPKAAPRGARLAAPLRGEDKGEREKENGKVKTPGARPTRFPFTFSRLPFSSAAKQPLGARLAGENQRSRIPVIAARARELFGNKIISSPLDLDYDFQQRVEAFRRKQLENIEIRGGSPFAWDSVSVFLTTNLNCTSQCRHCIISCNPK